MIDSKEFAEYLKDRYYKEIEWYNKKAMENKKIYEILQWIIIGFTIITPVFIVLEITIEHNLAYVSLVSSVIVALSASVSRSFKFYDNWINYRGICETLKKEIHLYNAHVGTYANTENSKSLFVERVEYIISKENDFWADTHKENKLSEQS